MRRNSRREALLADTVRKHQAATKKVSRLEANGVGVRGSKHDPRLSLSEVRQMSAAELHRYSRSLERFTSRKTQFVAGFDRQPFNKADWQKYEGLEARYNEITRQREAQIRDIRLPSGSGTIGSRMATVQDFRIFHDTHRLPGFVKDEKSLMKLIASMEQKVKPSYMRVTVAKRLNSLFALLEGSGNADFKEKVLRLTREQQLILLDYSTFGEIARDRFSSGDDAAVLEEDSNYYNRTGSDRQHDIRDDLQNVLDWASKIGISDGNVRSESAFDPNNTNAGIIPTQFNPRNTNAGPITLPKLPGRKGSRKKK